MTHLAAKTPIYRYVRRGTRLGLALAIENRCCSAPALQARLADAVATFSDGALQDDATLIVMAAD